MLASHRDKTTSTNTVLRFFSQCPENAFQKVQPGMPRFTTEQRLGAIVKNGAKLMGVGFLASMLGKLVLIGIASGDEYFSILYFLAHLKH